MPKTPTALILASTSPRRRELVTLFGLAFQFISADVDESPRADESPEELVRRLSRAKAEIGATQFPDALVIGADTIVATMARPLCAAFRSAPKTCHRSTILGKPTDANDAVRMLTRLRHRPHIVYSGATVMQDSKSITQVATTTVQMRNYSDREIAAFVATGEPFDKAAAYAIQNSHFRPVEYIEGCFANVMGLPLCHLYRALKAFGVQVDAPDRACQDHLGIVCLAAEGILEETVNSEQRTVNS